MLDDKDNFSKETNGRADTGFNLPPLGGTLSSVPPALPLNTEGLMYKIFTRPSGEDVLVNMDNVTQISCKDGVVTMWFKDVVLFVVGDSVLDVYDFIIGSSEKYFHDWKAKCKKVSSNG